MASLRTVIAENVQEYLKRSDWKAAIVEMEKLFAIDRDPIIRVRIGDARLKLDRKSSAIREYLRAAELFAEKGFVLKALAQYGLVLRLDPSNAFAKKKIAAMETLRPGKTAARLQHAPMEYRMPPPAAGVIPHYGS